MTMQHDDVAEMAASLREAHGHLLTRLEAAAALRRTSAGITTARSTGRPWALALERAAVPYGRRRMYPALVVAAVALRGDSAADYLAARQAQEVGHGVDQ